MFFTNIPFRRTCIFFSYCLFFAAQTGSYNVFRTSTYIYRLYTSQLFVDSASLANAMCHLISVCLSCHLTLAPLCCSCLFSMLDGPLFHFPSHNVHISPSPHNYFINLLIRYSKAQKHQGPNRFCLLPGD